jgi:hypothetical protein
MGSDGDRDGPPPAPGSTPGYWYAIRVEGLMDARWSRWLDGMTITHEEGGISRLEGPLVDQGALHGLLKKLRDLRLPILTVERLRAVDSHAPLPEEPPESTV